jgi:carbonic anhydrase/acetyltransferase-like protein (isoleucine patch superfamily)
VSVLNYFNAGHAVETNPRLELLQLYAGVVVADAKQDRASPKCKVKDALNQFMALTCTYNVLMQDTCVWHSYRQRANGLQGDGIHLAHPCASHGD